VTDNIVEIAQLSRRYGDTLAVDDASFGVREGQVTALLGPNGAGKTTLLRMLVGLIRPTSGRAMVAGQPFRTLPQPARVVGVHLDSFGYEPSISARRHLTIAAYATGTPRARVDEVLTLVGLEQHAKKRIGTLSQGMVKRLGLATAMIAQPRVLVLDEPGNGLDPAGQKWLRDLVRAHADAGGAVLVSSHQLADVERVADQVVILRQRVRFESA
jgi:ABC-2 type transport system ATP-binding protein